MPYLDFLKNILSANLKRPAFPFKLTYAVTYRCNYRCRTCNIWQIDSKGELTFDEIAEFFRKSNRFNWIDLTGGEVWLRKDFVDIVEVILKECRNLVMLHFPTNGYMTDQIVRGVESIMKLKPPRLVITCSTDGDEGVNDYVRGIKGGWRRQIETYKRLHAMPGVQVYLGMTLSSYNVEEYDRAFEAAKAECPWLKPTDFHMNVAHESSHYYDNVGSAIRGEDIEKTIAQVKRYRDLRGLPHHPIEIIERRYLKHVESYLRTGVTPIRCHAMRASCFIDPYGGVYPCTMYDAKVASLRDHDFDLRSIWEGGTATGLQKEIWDFDCPQCWTPCEAYQSIFCNFLTGRKTPRGVKVTHGKDAAPSAFTGK